MSTEEQEFDPCSIWNRGNDLWQEGKHDEALKDYLWFWHNALAYRRSLNGVRGSYFLKNFQKFAQSFPLASEALETLLHDTYSQVLKSPQGQLLADLHALTRALDRPALMIYVLDEMVARDYQEVKLHSHRFVTLLAEHSKWATLRYLLDQPDVWVERCEEAMFSLEKSAETTVHSNAMREAIGDVRKKYRLCFPLVLQTLVELHDEASLIATCKSLGGLECLKADIKPCRDYVLEIGRDDLVPLLNA